MVQPEQEGTEVDVIFLLDESGSMKSMGHEPIDAINDFVNEQKTVKDKSLFSLFTFNTKLKKVYSDIPMQEVPAFTSKDFNPSNMTALLDSMGQVMLSKRMSPRNKNVVMVILTDGAENSSRHYNQSQIRELTGDLQDNYNWKFIYLGANQDSFQTGTGMGLARNCCADYETSFGGCSAATRNASSAVRNYKIDSSNSKDAKLSL